MKHRREFIKHTSISAMGMMYGMENYQSLINFQYAKKAGLKLWYLQPADAKAKDEIFNAHKDDKEWLNALPLGNGALGAMVFGGVDYERIQLNEETIWSGSNMDSDNPESFKALAKIRELLFAGKYKEASKLTGETQICKSKGSSGGRGANAPFGCFQTLGDLFLEFNTNGGYENYYRELDLNDATVRVKYSQGGVKYEREIFTSHPDKVFVMKIKASQKGKINFTCSLNRPERYTTEAKGNQLIMSGAMNDGTGGDGLKYLTVLEVATKNGKVETGDKKLIVSDADEVILFLTATTDYKLEYPTYKRQGFEAQCYENINAARNKTYEELFNRHKAEYQQYFNRVNFKVSNSKPQHTPTDKSIQDFKQNPQNDHLVELLFQYGRYLLISSSRPGCLPANLQGIWANKIQTAWNGDYHTDVNVQMNYWPAEVTNLSEMHLPLFDLLESLQKPGAKTAKIHYNANGWVLHPITNIWGFTSPGEVAGWGMHIGGGGWLASHIMEHYLFTSDTEFLKRMYPVLKSCVEFFLDWLVPHPVSGELISGPSVSPENAFIAPDGSRCQISMGPAHDQQVIWHILQNFIQASAVLNIKDLVVDKAVNAKDKIAKPKIGGDGRLMEWDETFEEVEPGHRHISHLFALHPGNQIDLYETPNLALAAKQSLKYRLKNGGGHTGWSAAWLINQFARLGDGDGALEHINTVLKKSTSPNLFGLHPPFQMDANFGFTAGVAEMLLQSHTGEIRILPALPRQWANGEVKGLCAKGGFVVDIIWVGGMLKSFTVLSKYGGKCDLRHGDKKYSFQSQGGKKYKLKPEVFK